MIIFTNGNAMEIPAHSTLGEVVRRLELDPRTIIAEVNEEALQRNEWQTRPLQENDRVEFLRIAAGG
ncbi:MAG: sulfur carrier protein ThiS [Candidatus Methylacidiphilales bacterium]